MDRRGKRQAAGNGPGYVRPLKQDRIDCIYVKEGDICHENTVSER